MPFFSQNYTEYSTLHYFGISSTTRSKSHYVRFSQSNSCDSNQNCIVGVLLTCPLEKFDYPVVEIGKPQSELISGEELASLGRKDVSTKKSKMSI